MNEMQKRALTDLCDRFKVDFNPEHYRPQFDLPAGYVAGWVGGMPGTIYVGCAPDGRISS